MFWATNELTFVLIRVIANPLWDRNYFDLGRCGLCEPRVFMLLSNF